MKTLLMLPLILMLASLAVADPVLNDTCDSAAYLANIHHDFSINLCDYSNDYTMPDGSCVDGNGAGPDAVYRWTFPGTEAAQVTAETESGMPVSMYLITDCGDPAGSCVAGSTSTADTPALIDFSGLHGALYFLVIDTEGECDVVNVGLSGAVATDTPSWSTVKSLYR